MFGENKDRAELSGQHREERTPWEQDLNEMRNIAFITAALIFYVVHLTISTPLKPHPSQYEWKDESAIAAMAREAAFHVHLVAVTVTLFSATGGVLFLLGSVHVVGHHEDTDKSTILIRGGVLLLTVGLVGILVIYTTRIVVVSPASTWAHVGAVLLCWLVGILLVALFYKLHRTAVND